MAQQIEIENFGGLNLTYSDRLINDTIASQAQVQVTDVSEFTVGSYVIIGALGQDGSETRIIQSLDDASHMTFSQSLALPHSRFDPVTVLSGDKIKVYSAPNVTGLPPSLDTSTFSLVTTVPILFSEMFTLVTDPVGGSNTWYAFTYLNSTNGYETNLAESQAIRGGGYDYYCSTYDIRKAAGFIDNPYVTNADIDAKRKEAQDEIDGALQGMYDVPFQPPINAMVSGMTRLLAAGLLLMENPGAAGMSSAIYQQGMNFAQDARTMLNQIVTRKRFITNAIGQQTLDPNSKVSKSWPNVTTDQTDSSIGGSYRNFRMSDVQGYEGRRY